MTATSIALNVSSALLDNYRGSITAVWTYQMHRTKITYTVGSTKQYGYRCANNGDDYEVKANGETVDVSNSNNSYDGWWVTQKPF